MAQNGAHALLDPEYLDRIDALVRDDAKTIARTLRGIAAEALLTADRIDPPDDRVCWDDLQPGHEIYILGEAQRVRQKDTLTIGGWIQRRVEVSPIDRWGSPTWVDVAEDELFQLAEVGF